MLRLFLLLPAGVRRMAGERSVGPSRCVQWVQDAGVATGAGFGPKSTKSPQVGTVFLLYETYSRGFV